MTAFVWFFVIVPFWVLMTPPLWAEAVHGRSLYGDPPKYAKDFKHFDYVNPNAPKGGTVVFSSIGTFDSLNPFVVKGVPAAGLGGLYASYLHATLLDNPADEPFTRYGYIAESLEVAPDNSSVTFYLRPEATFHDGTPIRADDVIYTFQMLTQKGTPLYRSYYGDVKEVKKLNDLRVQFIFSTTQNRELPLILGDMPILSKKFYEQHGFEKADLTPPVGSGPYKIVQVKPGHSLIYERIKGWWGENLPIHKGRYNFDYIRYDYYRDDTVDFEGFKSGAIDFRFENSARNWAVGYDFPLAQQGKILREEIVIETPRPMNGFVFNTRRDMFKDRRVRQALSYCFDFEWTNKNLFYNLYQRTKSYFDGSELAAVGKPTAAELVVLAPYKEQIPPEVLTDAFVPPVTDGSGHMRDQLIKARALLKEAGYSIQNGQMVHVKTGKPLTFTILLQSPQLERVTQGFINNLKKLGIKATMRTVDTAQYIARLEAFDFDMLFQSYAQSMSPGNEQRNFWHSARADLKGGRNYAGIKDPVIDAIVEKLILATSRKELIIYTKVLDRLLLWGYYLIPGYHSKALRLAYAAKLKRPLHLPPYSFDIDSWWIDAAATKK
jgi:microcin C transport system substrate-binding protein